LPWLVISASVGESSGVQNSGQGISTMTGTHLTREEAQPLGTENVIGNSRNVQARRWFEIRRVFGSSVSENVHAKADKFSLAKQALIQTSDLLGYPMDTLCIVAVDLVMIGHPPSREATADKGSKEDEPSN
jgi:hypothetical protein